MVRRILNIIFFASFLMTSSLGLASETLSKAGNSYKLGVGDVIQVSVLQPDKMDVTLTVAPDGTVVFPQIGQITVQDLTPFEIQEKIQNALREYINYPLVSVSLQESHSQNFYVYGEVLRPGAYPLKERSTVLQAIALAGGFTRAASLGNIKVVRQNFETMKSQTLNVDLSGTNEMADLFSLVSGDVITVARNSDIFVYGEVHNPGPYALEENTTILQAIVMAGGFTPVAAMDKVKLTRRISGSAQNETKLLDLSSPGAGESMSELKAEPGDVITISKRFF